MIERGASRERLAELRVETDSTLAAAEPSGGRPPRRRRTSSTSKPASALAPEQHGVTRRVAVRDSGFAISLDPGSTFLAPTLAVSVVYRDGRRVVDPRS